MILDRIKKHISGELKNMLNTEVKKAIFQQLDKMEKLAKTTKDFPYDDLLVEFLRGICEELFDIEIDGFVTRDTQKAILISYADHQYWIPKSQIHDDSEVYEAGTDGTLIIPRWLAEEKGLV